MKKKILAGILTMAMLCTGLAGCGSKNETVDGESKEKKVSITISVPDPDASYIYQAAEEFAKRANEYSDGSLEFKVSGNGSLYGGDTAAGIKQLSAGSLQMLILASSVYASFEPGYNVISVPYMFDDQQQFLDYLNSDVGTELMNRVSDMGITTVGKWTRSMRKVTNSVRPVNTPEDLDGMVLRVPNNSLYVEFFGACGAVTTPMNFSEVYNALQLNTLDGQENPIAVFNSSKFAEVQSNVLLWDGVRDTNIWVISNKTLEKLSPEDAKIIQESAVEALQWGNDYLAANESSIIENLEKNGTKFARLTDEERQEFKEACAGIFVKYVDVVGPDVIDLFQGK